MANTGRYYKWVSIATVATANSQAAAAANNAAINALALTYKNTDTALYVPPGIWWHNGVLIFDSVQVFGEGASSILQGYDGTNSPLTAINLTGTRPALRWVAVNVVGASVRSASNSSCGVLVNNAAGHLLEQVYVSGPAGAGFNISNAQYGREVLCTTQGSFADGFYRSGLTANAENDRCVASNTGDDYFSVVSYQSQGGVCSNVLTHDFQGLGGQITGRGATVVGGTNVVYRAGYVEKCANFGLYAAQESAYTTYGVQSSTFNGITVSGVGVVNPVNGYGVCTNSDDAGNPVNNVTFTACTVRGSMPQALVSVRSNCTNVNTSGVNYSP